MLSFLFFASGYPITSFIANQAERYFRYGGGYQCQIREVFKRDLLHNTQRLSVKVRSSIDDRTQCLSIENRSWQKSLLSGFPVSMEQFVGFPRVILRKFK